MSDTSFVPQTSYAEQRFFDFWQKHQIPYTLHWQYKIDHDSGRYAYYADFAHLESRTIIEIDGKKYHSSPEQIAKDQRRQCYLEQRGWKVIRFPAKKVYLDPVRSVLRAKGAIDRRLP